ncbi:P-loop containing nucleoside triphosphate hydrolase protein [Thelonectria olida]|uniref:P-loop containing nucleoside triphosphate hydrolase protein n=1 Tax=Thelonectria olida TaxID=1576542 RepID=A0A9P8W7S1_9HYPO|nr:P-loop containing nucleoside triphosphate hydrolase protein [Thelonectria olida]
MAQTGPPDLQSQRSRDVLDIIDALRSQGISHFVDLPQIIVCGDQSSGKSSVLEAISGMPFPTKDTLCTRFATELILRRSSVEQDNSVKVSILPGPDRDDVERKALEAFRFHGKEIDLCSVIDDATEAIGLRGTNKVFCTDILRVEVSSPSQPHLTLVDLPGLFVAGNKDQSMEDAKLVESLVISYMEQPRSIILAVVSAKSEFALQQVTQRAREKDPGGHRTLGLITKPDTLHEGSESERAYIELAQNTDVKLQLGWHVLRNRDFPNRHVTRAERDADERAFFSKAPWTSLDSRHVGVDALRTRLSRVLHDQISTHLPLVLKDMRSGIARCKASLCKLGAVRDSTSEQRRYLLKISQEFTRLVKASIDGDYSSRSFFGDSTTPSGVMKRLRARVQFTLMAFAEKMRLLGHSKLIVDEDPSIGLRRGGKTLMTRNRGCELPGTFNPLIIGEMFADQCKPWRELAEKSVAIVVSAARATLLAILEHGADIKTAEGLRLALVEPKIVELEALVQSKLTELLEPHTEGHPITYNHYLTENVQKAQQARHERQIESAVAQFFPPTSSNPIVKAELLKAVVKSTEPNMETYASNMAIDLMQAYYKVALKKFIDDVSVLAIERCLIQKLPSTMSLDTVCDLTDKDVHRLVGESADTTMEREQVAGQLKVLEDGLSQLSLLK